MMNEDRDGKKREEKERYGQIKGNKKENGRY
jgi:hypothetical protein